MTLDATQSNHLKNVLRLKPGSLVEIFNKHARSFQAEVLSTPAQGGVELKIISEITRMAGINGINITLACAIAKGSRMDWLVEKTAEIGLNRLIPIITSRTVVKPNSYSLNKIARWHKLAMAAAKQTGQNNVLTIDNPLPFRSLTELIKDFRLSLIGVPNAAKYLPEALEKCSLSEKSRILYMIGPEGDFTMEEIADAVKCGAQPVRLPVNSTLRVETAAITMLAMLLYHSAINETAKKT